MLEGVDTLEREFDRIKRFCLDDQRVNCFLVEKDHLADSYVNVKELVDLRLVIAVVPFVVNIVVGGARARDQGLDEMSTVYRLGRRRYLLDVLGRQVAPALLAATRTSFAFAWKLIVLVEALTQPRGIGAQIYYSFRLLRPDHMISLALLFIVVLRTTEALVFAPLERKLLGWMR